jgi:hypothetical protein
VGDDGILLHRDRPPSPCSRCDYDKGPVLSGTAVTLRSYEVGVSSGKPNGPTTQEGLGPDLTKTTTATTNNFLIEARRESKPATIAHFVFIDLRSSSKSLSLS